VPSSSGSRRIETSVTVYQLTLQEDCLPGLLDREDKGRVVLRNVGSCSLMTKRIVSRLESVTTVNLALCVRGLFASDGH
jgi:hypothetical protein